MKNLYQKRHRLYKSLSTGIALLFFLNTVIPAPVLAQGLSLMPALGATVPLSPAFTPALLQGIRVDPENPFLFNFFVHPGDDDLKGEVLQAEAQKMIKYFLASLTIPEKDLWVNLSPYEKDRVVPEDFGKTDMGRDLLAQDYLLKQITASLIYPEGEIGKKFWERIYKKAYEQYGTTQIPVDTFNKVWIMPQKATVYQHGSTAFVAESKLKVMLEEDYLALSRSSETSSVNRETPSVSRDTLHASQNTIASSIVREIVIPELEKEVNVGKNFAELRQVYQALILADWFKKTLKESLLAKVYAGKNKVAGLDVYQKDAAEKIFTQYVAAYKQGTYNLIRTEYDAYSKKTIPRKYFSGGVTCLNVSSTIINDPDKLSTVSRQGIIKNVVDYSVQLVSSSISADQLKSDKNIGVTIRDFVRGREREVSSIKFLIKNGHSGSDFRSLNDFRDALAKKTLKDIFKNYSGVEINIRRSGVAMVVEFLEGKPYVTAVAVSNKINEQDFFQNNIDQSLAKHGFAEKVKISSAVSSSGKKSGDSAGEIPLSFKYIDQEGDDVSVRYVANPSETEEFKDWEVGDTFNSYQRKKRNTILREETEEREIEPGDLNQGITVVSIAERGGLFSSEEIAFGDSRDQFWQEYLQATAGERATETLLKEAREKRFSVAAVPGTGIALFGPGIEEPIVLKMPGLQKIEPNDEDKFLASLYKSYLEKAKTSQPAQKDDTIAKRKEAVQKLIDKGEVYLAEKVKTIFGNIDYSQIQVFAKKDGQPVPLRDFHGKLVMGESKIAIVIEKKPKSFFYSYRHDDTEDKFDMITLTLDLSENFPQGNSITIFPRDSGYSVNMTRLRHEFENDVQVLLGNKPKTIETRQTKTGITDIEEEEENPASQGPVDITAEQKSLRKRLKNYLQTTTLQDLINALNARSYGEKIVSTIVEPMDAYAMTKPLSSFSKVILAFENRYKLVLDFSDKQPIAQAVTTEERYSRDELPKHKIAIAMQEIVEGIIFGKSMTQRKIEEDNGRLRELLKTDIRTFMQKAQDLYEATFPGANWRNDGRTFFAIKMGSVKGMFFDKYYDSVKELPRNQGLELNEEISFSATGTINVRYASDGNKIIVSENSVGQNYNPVKFADLLDRILNKDEPAKESSVPGWVIQSIQDDLVFLSQSSGRGNQIDMKIVHPDGSAFDEKTETLSREDFIVMTYADGFNSTVRIPLARQDADNPTFTVQSDSPEKKDALEFSMKAFFRSARPKFLYLDPIVKSAPLAQTGWKADSTEVKNIINYITTSLVKFTNTRVESTYNWDHWGNKTIDKPPSFVCNVSVKTTSGKSMKLVEWYDAMKKNSADDSQLAEMVFNFSINEKGAWLKISFANDKIEGIKIDAQSPFRNQRLGMLIYAQYAFRRYMNNPNSLTRNQDVMIDDVGGFIRKLEEKSGVKIAKVSIPNAGAGKGSLSLERSAFNVGRSPVSLKMGDKLTLFLGNSGKVNIYFSTGDIRDKSDIVTTEDLDSSSAEEIKRVAEGVLLGEEEEVFVAPIVSEKANAFKRAAEDILLGEGVVEAEAETPAPAPTGKPAGPMTRKEMTDLVRKISESGKAVDVLKTIYRAAVMFFGNTQYQSLFQDVSIKPSGLGEAVGVPAFIQANGDKNIFKASNTIVIRGEDRTFEICILPALVPDRENPSDESYRLDLTQLTGLSGIVTNGQITDFRNAIEQAFRAAASSSLGPTGGIDLTQTYQSLNIKVDASGSPLPIEFQDMEQIHFDGLVPVILNVTPVINLPLLLGLSSKNPQELAQRI